MFRCTYDPYLDLCNYLIFLIHLLRLDAQTHVCMNTMPHMCIFVTALSNMPLIMLCMFPHGLYSLLDYEINVSIYHIICMSFILYNLYDHYDRINLNSVFLCLY